jgi:hypothetical protein
MGFVTPTGQNPSPNTNTSSSNDFFDAIGLMGILSGNSNGHAVRALPEIIDVSGRERSAWWRWAAASTGQARAPSRHPSPGRT